MQDTGTCTSGFVFEIANGNTYLSTAGHCAPNQGSNATVAIGGESSGPAGTYQYIPASNRFFNDSTADVVLVGMANSEASNLVDRSHGTKDHPMTVRQVIDNYPIGSRVCISAKVIQHRCGTVTDSSRSTVNTAGIRLLNQVEWQWTDTRNLTSLGGSSGGPLFDGNVALGTHSRSSISRTGGISTFVMAGSKLGQIQQQLASQGFIGAQVGTAAV